MVKTLKFIWSFIWTSLFFKQTENNHTLSQSSHVSGMAYNISVTSENTRDISVSKMNRKIRRNPPICLILFSLAHKHKHRRISTSISTRKTNMFVFLELMLVLMLVLMLMRKWEQISAVSFFCLCFCFCRGCSHLLMFMLCSCLCLCLCASENQPLEKWWGRVWGEYWKIHAKVNDWKKCSKDEVKGKKSCRVNYIVITLHCTNCTRLYGLW